MVFRGGLPKCSLSKNGIDEHPTLDELDAQLIEEILIRMRQRRQRLYRLARLTYLADKPNTILCQAFRCGETKLYRLRGQLFSYVGRKLVEKYEKNARIST